MDNAAIKAAVEASRRVTETVGGRTFTLRLPTQHEVEMAYLRARGDGNHEAATSACMRFLLERSIVGWTEVVTTDLVPDVPPEPVPWSADLVPIFLDVQSEIADELKEKFSARLNARQKKTAEAQKN